MSQKLFRTVYLKISFCLICLLASASTALAQDKTTVSTGAQSEARKAFEKMKALSGSWQGTIMSIPINVTIRLASSGTAVLYEANTSNEGPPKREITMFYMDGDKLLATHYCDAGNRARFEGKMSPDGKTSEFDFLDVAGSTKGGLVKRMKFTVTDENRHLIEFTFIMPNGKPIELRGEFQRTASTASPRSANKRLYDSGTMMILLSAVKTPEEFYNFKPAESSGSFAQMLALVTNLQYANCSAVLEEKNAKAKIDGTKTSKAELIAALKDAFAYCGKAYDQMNDESAAQTVIFSSPMGPVPTPKHQLLSINTGQNAIHYGNLMIYMRLKNIVPPSDDPEILKQAEKLFKKQ